MSLNQFFWHSMLSYLGVSPRAVAVRSQGNISALWLCADQQTTNGQICAFWLASTMPCLESTEDRILI